MDTSLKYVCDARLAGENSVMWLDCSFKGFKRGAGIMDDELVNTLEWE
jgi:hypothetical protein